MSEHIQKLFDDIAPKYDLLNSLLSCKIDDRWRREAVLVINQSSPKNVLDLCAGTLALTRALLKANSACHITAVDFSEAMLKKGEESLSGEEKQRVVIQVQDAHKMDLQPGSFDVVMCAYGLRNIDDNPLVLKSIFSLLRPGGRLVILDFFKPETFLSRLFNLTYAQFVIPLLGGFVSRHKKAYQHLRDSVRHFYTPTGYEDLLKSIGFQNITLKSQTGGVSHLIQAEKSL